MGLKDISSLLIEKNTPALLIFTLFFSIIFVLASPHFFVSGDTIVLINSVKTIVTCLQDKKYDFCPNISHFPLSQHILGLTFYKLGASLDQLMSGFKYLNIFAWFTGLLIPLFWWKSPSRHIHLLIYFTVYLSSPLWWYGNTSFNEIVSSTLVSLFFMSMMYGTYLPGITTFLVILTKEINLAYILFWTAIVLYIRYKKGESNIKSTLVSSVFGSLVGLVFQVLFNLWRFDSFFNKDLLVPLFRTPTWDIKFNYFFAQWLAPNVGIFFFWPAFIALLILFFFHRASAINWIIRGAVALFFISITFGFASWFAPFGWIAYGHRLIIPWIPGVTLFILYALSDNIILILKKTASVSFLPHLVKSYIILFAIPSIVILFSIGGINSFFAFDNECPRTAILQLDTKFYFDCIQHYAWGAKWIHNVTFAYVYWNQAVFPLIVLVSTLLILFAKIDRLVNET